MSVKRKKRHKRLMGPTAANPGYWYVMCICGGLDNYWLRNRKDAVVEYREHIDRETAVQSPFEPDVSISDFNEVEEFWKNE